MTFKWFLATLIRMHILIALAGFGHQPPVRVLSVNLVFLINVEYKFPIHLKCVPWGQHVANSVTVLFLSMVVEFLLIFGINFSHLTGT